MGTWFRVRRFVVVGTGAFVVLGAVYLLRGQPPGGAAGDAAIWSLVTAAVFTLGRLVPSRRGQHCALCNDTPKTLGSGRDAAS